jgi:serine phosphatase RsbU (regulator of sigma subunit)
VKVRTQLVLAFLLLAVLPLMGIVLYSYSTSGRAFRQAVEAESWLLAQEMSDRLNSVRGDLGERLEEIGQLPVRALSFGDGAIGEAGRVYVDLMARMGDVGELVDFFEFEPVTAGSPADPDSPAELGSSGSLEPFIIHPSERLAKALKKLADTGLSLEEAGITQEYLQATMGEAIRDRRLFDEAELEGLDLQEAEMKRLLGTELTSPVRRGDEIVGYLKARVPPHQILRQVLARTPREEGEIPYALDQEGELYVKDPRDRVKLEEIGIAADESDTSPDWIVVQTPDTASGLTFGIARPVEESLREIRRTAVRNFSSGLGMVVLALVGVLLLSGRMTRNLTVLTEGAERLAGGDLLARVPVRTRDEFGQLAETLNRMAQELSEHQQRLLEEERLRKEQEIKRRLLEAEHERKSRELEEARRFQLSLLPKELPSHPNVEVAVFMRTATEVGGDYYDFFPSKTGSVLTTAIGDAAGHGAKAGIMVTVVKGLFMAAAGDEELPLLLGEATGAIKRMNLDRMNMAVGLVRIDGEELTVSAAGMPPVLLYRRGDRAVSEIVLEGTPLGSLADAVYQEKRMALSPGDTLLLMTDGFPELLDGDGEPLGYDRVREIFAESGDRSPEQIIAELSKAAAAWNGGEPPDDDITFVVLKMKDGFRT